MIKKRNYFTSTVSEERRISNDVLLLDQKDFWDGNEQPYFADSTTAIFLTQGSMEISVNMTDYTVNAPAMLIYLEGTIISQGQLSDGRGWM